MMHFFMLSGANRPNRLRNCRQVVRQRPDSIVWRKSKLYGRVRSRFGARPYHGGA